LEKHQVIRNEALVELPAVSFISTHFRSSIVPWSYLDYTVGEIDVFYHHKLSNIYQIKDNWLYVHNLLGPQKPESHIDNKILGALNSLGVIPEFETHNLVRAQVNCVHKTQKSCISPPHRDFDDPGCVYVYYINDSDGDTVIYGEDGEIEGKVTPKSGHMVRMDSKQYHSATTPTRTDRRFVINLNFAEKTT
jgi:hypothetical protein